MGKFLKRHAPTFWMMSCGALITQEDNTAVLVRTVNK